MKISVITVVYNRVHTVEKAIQSVLRQDYPNVEYVVVDGGSTDGTLAILHRYMDRIQQFVSGPDEGLYDALNKGIRLATGDVVGILHADDWFAGEGILSAISRAFAAEPSPEAVYGDIAFIKAGTEQRVVRYYSSARFTPSLLNRGYIPAHPSFFCRRDCFERYGYYKTHYEIAADYELFLRFFTVHQLKAAYLPLRVTNMNPGGKSTSGLQSTLRINREILQACRENGVRTNYFKLYSRYFFKWSEFFIQREKR